MDVAGVQAPHRLRKATSQSNAHTIMLFTPRNQVRNMLDAEIGQALCNRGDLTKIAALSSLMNRGDDSRNSLFVEDNWMDDDDLWI